MTEKEIQAIVEEVIRRICLADEKKKILIVLRSPADADAVDRYLQETGNVFGVTKLYLSGVEGADRMQNCDLQALMDEHCSLLLAGVTLKQLIRIQEMRLEDPAAELTAEALRLGKPVTILSKWIDTAGGAPAYVRRIDQLKKTLAAYGVTFASEKRPEGTRDINTENKAENCRFHKHRIDKRVIAKQDLKHVLQGELEIRDDAVMTTTAKDLLKKRNIKVTRYQG